MKLKVTWSWNNWTFGIWWLKAKFPQRRHRPVFGVDLGPLELTWTGKSERRTR